jgi:hypothetical protein
MCDTQIFVVVYTLQNLDKGWIPRFDFFVPFFLCVSRDTFRTTAFLHGLFAKHLHHHLYTNLYEILREVGWHFWRLKNKNACLYNERIGWELALSDVAELKMEIIFS